MWAHMATCSISMLEVEYLEVCVNWRSGQVVRRRSRKPKITGSNPVCAFFWMRVENKRPNLLILAPSTFVRKSKHLIKNICKSLDKQARALWRNG